MLDTDSPSDLALLTAHIAASPPPGRRVPMLTWATSERDLAAVAGTRARRRAVRPLPPCAKAPRVCRALMAMSA